MPGSAARPGSERAPYANGPRHGQHLGHRRVRVQAVAVHAPRRSRQGPPARLQIHQRQTPRDGHPPDHLVMGGQTRAQQAAKALRRIHRQRHHQGLRQRAIEGIQWTLQGCFGSVLAHTVAQIGIIDRKFQQDQIGVGLAQRFQLIGGPGDIAPGRVMRVTITSRSRQPDSTCATASGQS